MKKVKIQLTSVSIVHEDAGLMVGQKYEAMIPISTADSVSKAVFPIKGIEHHAWVITGAAEKRDGLTYAKIIG